MEPKIENQICTIILDQAFKIHTELGPGLLESVYEKCLQYELIQAGYIAESQVPVPMNYKTIRFEAGFRIDLLVENKVLVEIKSIENLAPVHFAQTLTYIKMKNIKLGLLINFNTKRLKDGIHRVANGL
ncbi:GxxExxY protein [Gillisia sp. Hel_I_86]|uniref:GxxExxY protein n=1 Tax=Gillisia sp. Hel_I_86 TaxID=1249981 RepID=UPI00119C88C1|nr:GxxExxY protein [Gillisia sp. Hel_I_86]TVZ26041.1 GxxExxY protein [Gillisia sp. Hel_I_86]